MSCSFDPSGRFGRYLILITYATHVIADLIGWAGLGADLGQAEMGTGPITWKS